MLNKPTVVELLNKAENRYSLVVATAKRARQISQGSAPLTQDEDTSPITLAADEIDEGKIKIYNENQWKEYENGLEKSEESYNEEKTEASDKEETEETDKEEETREENLETEENEDNSQAEIETKNEENKEKKDNSEIEMKTENKKDSENEKDKVEDKNLEVASKKTKKSTKK